MPSSEDAGCFEQTFSCLGEWLCRKTLSKKMNIKVREYLFPPLIRLEQLRTASHLIRMVIEKMDFDAQYALLRSSKFGKLVVESFGNEIERITLKQKNNSFGIRLYYPFEDKGPYFVRNVVEDSIASEDGRLRPGDEIMRVNRKKILDKRWEELSKLFLSKKTCVLVVRRHKQFLYKEDLLVMRDLLKEPFWRERKTATKFEMKLLKSENIFGMGILTSASLDESPNCNDDGFLVYSHFVISTVPNSPAYGKLKVGDQIIAANGRKLDDRQGGELADYFESFAEVRLLIERRN